MITAKALTSVWDIRGVGAYLEIPPGAANLALRADFTINARISTDGRYRLETHYQYNQDVIVFDGTNTFAFRGVINPDGTRLGADVVILSGPFPEYLAGYIQAAWMATYLNWSLHHQISSDVFTYLGKSRYLQELLGPELASQIAIKTSESSDSTLIRAYLPGNATKDGKPVFTSPSYKSGLLFEQIHYSHSSSSDPLYRVMELTSFKPYREPTSPEDVAPIFKYHIQLQHITPANAIETNMPDFDGLVGVLDYSTASHTNRSVPLAYGIRQWDDLPRAQIQAREVSEAVAPSSKRWLVLLILCAGLLPVMLRYLLARRPAYTDAVCVTNNNKNNNT